MGGAEAADQGAPEPGLPVVLGGRPRLPAEHQLRPVGDVAIEGVGDATRQLQGAAAGAPLRADVGALQPGGQRGEGRGLLAVEQPGEQLEDRPRQVIRAPQVRRDVGIAEHRAEELVHQPRGEREAHVGADPEAVRELHRQPAGHALAVHDHRLGRQRAVGGVRQHLGQAGGQLLDSVAAVDEHGCGARGRRGRRGRG